MRAPRVPPDVWVDGVDLVARLRAYIEGADDEPLAERIEAWVRPWIGEYDDPVLSAAVAQLADTTYRALIRRRVDANGPKGLWPCGCQSRQHFDGRTY